MNYQEAQIDFMITIMNKNRQYRNTALGMVKIYTDTWVSQFNARNWETWKIIDHIFHVWDTQFENALSFKEV